MTIAMLMANTLARGEAGGGLIRVCSRRVARERGITGRGCENFFAESVNVP